MVEFSITTHGSLIKKHIFRYNIVDFLKLQIGRIAFG